MDLRVTPQSLTGGIIASLQQTTANLGVLQQQADTGNSINNPSDNPLGMVSVMEDNTQNLQLSSYLTNIQSATSTLNLSSSTLDSAANILSQAQAIAVQGASVSTDSASDQALADQVNALLGQLVSLANTQQNGQYLYAGTAIGTVPFVATKNSQGQITGVAYQGSQEQGASPVSQQQSVATLYAGNQVFQQQQRGQTVLTGTTGASVGTGTDSATGQGTLLVSHTSTTYAPGSGVQAGTNSAKGDTILGPAGANTLTIDDTSGTGTSGTISLNGGPAVAFSSGDTNLAVTGPSGEVVYVNTSAITPGFTGTVNITANGTLSTDNGATSVPITFSGNQVVTNSATGGVTNINSTNIRQAGTDNLAYPGTYDAFQVLVALRNDLQNTQALSGQGQQGAISGLIGEIQRNQQNILNVAGEQGADVQNLQTLQNQVQSTQLQIKTQISNLQSADITQVVVNLQEQQNLMQFTMEAATISMNQNLVNFLLH